MKVDHELLARVKQLAPGFYTERDGGPWYIVTPDSGDRIGDGFENRDDARRLLCWLAGDAKPKGWTITGEPTRRGRDITIPGRYTATLWMHAVAKHFPNFKGL